MKTGIVMITLGGPRSLAEVPDFIKCFIGRELPAPAMEAVIERYRLIGGFSPLPAITEEQSRRLNDALGSNFLCLPAFRYAQPTIAQAIDSMDDAAVAELRFLLLSPFYTSVTTGNYIETAKAYLEEKSFSRPVSFIHSWYQEPLFIDSWVGKIKTEAFDEQGYYLFSAHSLPLKYATEPYQRQIEASMSSIAAAAGLRHYSLGWQSIPSNAPEPWITPTVEEKLDEIAAAGCRRVIQVPIGFTADHIETLYDIDITHRQHALNKGLVWRRLTSLNAGSSFIGALHKIATNFAIEES